MNMLYRRPEDKIKPLVNILFPQADRFLYILTTLDPKLYGNEAVLYCLKRIHEQGSDVRLIYTLPENTETGLKIKDFADKNLEFLIDDKRLFVLPERERMGRPDFMVAESNGKGLFFPPFLLQYDELYYPWWERSDSSLILSGHIYYNLSKTEVSDFVNIFNNHLRTAKTHEKRI